MGDTVIAEDRGECSFIWDNYYYDEEKINEYDLTLFIREEGKEKNLYRKYQETHYQRGYTLDEMKELIQSSGLIFETAYDLPMKHRQKKVNGSILLQENMESYRNKQEIL